MYVDHRQSSQYHKRTKLDCTINQNNNNKMKVKRTAENQLNKDAYEADPDDRFAEVPDPGQGMTKASADVMQRRKIVKVSRYV